MLSLASDLAMVMGDQRTQGSLYTSVEKELRSAIKYGGNIAAAIQVGTSIAERGVKAGVIEVAFDRSGFKYHGRVKALADAAREGGLKF